MGCLSKVFIDSGHGGTDPGACSGNVKEKDINLEVGLMLGEMLTKEGFTVGYSRTTDTYVSLAERANKSNRFGAKVFISIHCNAHSNKQAQGVETFYYRTSSKGKVLADKVQKNILSKAIVELQIRMYHLQSEQINQIDLEPKCLYLFTVTLIPINKLKE